MNNKHSHPLSLKNMKTFLQLSLFIVGIASGVCLEFCNLPEWCTLLLGSGGGVTLGFALGVPTYHDIPEEILATIRQWHGSISQKQNNITILLLILKEQKEAWNVPEEFITKLDDYSTQLDQVIAKCHSVEASSADRGRRNELLAMAVKMCTTLIKSWAHHQHFSGVLSAHEVHMLGFFVPGETSGYRARKIPTHATAEVKVDVTHLDNICVVLDHAADSNAARTKGAWPKGVHNAVIVILTADGSTEVHRQMTTRVHTHIELPKSTRGHQLIAKAAFLQHVDDVPRFSKIEPMFSMPLSVEDLAATLDDQYQQERDERARELERYEKEINRLRAELEARTNK
jgi:hypothetical protein